jgi:hypothetical protein
VALTALIAHSGTTSSLCSELHCRRLCRLLQDTSGRRRLHQVHHHLRLLLQESLTERETDVNVTLPIVQSPDSQGNQTFPPNAENLLKNFTTDIGTQGLCGATANGNMCGGLEEATGKTVDEESEWQNGAASSSHQIQHRRVLKWNLYLAAFLLQ